MNVYEILDRTTDPAVVAEIRRMDKSGEAAWKFSALDLSAGLYSTDGRLLAAVTAGEDEDVELADELL
ncbi:hypothetical protein SEA_ALTADENA_72 [Arthrobacter phage Altadena]|uniref:Uncharacterized protein n=1 Tax=Arthrobacter phage Altadena TaxID=3059064 RepID=A0AA96HVK8_9CAUD|nr:hypothetical protein SEA_ALTADENA_72 [Arthrobacter phage Altadena]